MIRKIISHVRNRGPRHINSALDVFYTVHQRLVDGISHAKTQQNKNAKKVLELDEHNSQLQGHIDKAAKALDRLGEFLF